MRKYIFWLVVFATLEIGIALYLTTWREHFWNTVSNKEQLNFLWQLGLFTSVALVACFVAGFSGYLISLTTIKWREKLNAKALRICNFPLENFNQRVQEDCMVYPDLLLNLLFGFIKSVIYVVVFCAAIVMLFHWSYLIVILVYSLVGTLITKYIASPLISLNYRQQRAEATYRNCLTIENFSDCVFLMLGLAKKQKQLTYFQQFYAQVGVIIPLVIIAPAYFSSAMTLGMLMRFNSSTATVLDNLSYGINSFNMINRFISCRKRLKEASII